MNLGVGDERGNERGRHERTRVRVEAIEAQNGGEKDRDPMSNAEEWGAANECSKRDGEPDLARARPLVLERQKRVEAASPLPIDTAPVPPALPNRLSPKLRSEQVLALEAEDHYVRVHTPAGSELVLLRLADAAREMGNTPGARTHRSWWVARSAVKNINRTSGKTTLLLLNDIEVPVSRGYLAELKEAGWLNG